MFTTSGLTPDTPFNIVLARKINIPRDTSSGNGSPISRTHVTELSCVEVLLHHLFE